MNNGLTFKKDFNRSKHINNVITEHNEPIEDIPILSESKKPFFNDLAREENQKYQKIRRENKSLNQLNKVYNKTKTKNNDLRERLLNNPLFIEDYKDILHAYKNNIRLDPETINILGLFDFRPLE